MLGERAVDHAVAEEPADPLAVHDERQPRLGVVRVHGRRVVGHVAHPFRPVPRDPRALRIPRLAVEIRRGAVVHHSAVERPAPRPVGIEAHACGVIGGGVLYATSALHQVACVRVAPGIDPVPCGGRAVVLEVCERRHLFVGRQVLAVDLLGDLIELWLQRVLVIECQAQDRVGELATLLLVQRLHAAEEVRQDPVIVASLALGRKNLVLPL